MASSVRYFDSTTPMKHYPIFKSLFDKVENSNRVEEIEKRRTETQSPVAEGSKHNSKASDGHMQTPEERQLEKQRRMDEAKRKVEENEAKWRDGSVSQEKLPTTLKGIAVKGLKKMSERVRKLCEEESFFAEDRVFTDGTVCYGTKDYSALTTTQVVYQFVREEDVSGSLRLADCHRIVDPADLGRPSYFISHAWKGNFEHLLTQIFKFVEENQIDENERFWLDVAAVNQHGGKDCHPLSQAQNQDDVRSFQEVLSVCDKGTVVILQLDRVNTAARAWCLFEWSWTLFYHGNKGLKFLGIGELQEAKKMLNSIYVEMAECYDPNDKEMILRDVRAHHGELPLFDDMLKEKLRAIFINQFHMLPPSKEVAVEESDEPTASVLFEDGDFDPNVPVSCLVYRKLGDAPEKLNSEIKRGDGVWSPFRSNYQKPESLYPGKVIAIKPVGSGGKSKSEKKEEEEEERLYIKFDDGDEDMVPVSQVFPGQGNPLFGETEYDSKQLCEPGSIVLATYRGRQRLYPGKVAVKAVPVAAPPEVAAAEGGGGVSSEPQAPQTYCIVAYDDGDFDPRVLESSIKPPAEEDGVSYENGPGKRVQAPWKGGSKLWPGRVLTVNEAKTYVAEKIKNTLTSKIEKIEEEATRQVANLKAQVATSLSVDAETFVYVKFDDGDVDAKVPLSLVVPKEDNEALWTPSDPESIIGFKVLAPFRGGSNLYSGTIARRVMVYVKFDDGDEDRDVLLDKCMQQGDPDLPVDPNAETLIGCKVMAPYKGSSTCYPGTIVEREEESEEEKAAAHLTSLFALAKTLR